MGRVPEGIKENNVLKIMSYERLAFKEVLWRKLPCKHDCLEMFPGKTTLYIRALLKQEGVGFAFIGKLNHIVQF